MIRVDSVVLLLYLLVIYLVNICLLYCFIEDLKDLIEDLTTQSVSIIQSFITLKNHKANFQNSLNCKLINPVKSEICIIKKSEVQTNSVTPRK